MSIPALLRHSLAVAAVGALAMTSSACASDEETARASVPSAPGAGLKLPAQLAPSTGKTYYVALDGKDTNPGTLELPWRTVQKALNRLAPGQRALVRGGTYVQDLVVRRGGSASAPITVAAFPGETVVLHAQSTSGDTYPIRIRSGAAYVRLRGFIIENAKGESSTNVYFEGNAHHIALVGNEIRFSQDQGIFAERTTNHLYILRNDVHGNGVNRAAGQHQSHGIYLEGTDHLVANNVVRDHAAGFGIQIYPANERTLVVNNTIVGNGLGGIVVGGEAGVRDITIRNNIIALNAGGYGVAMDSDCPIGGVEIDTNLIFANGSGAVETDCGHTSEGNVLEDPRFVDYAVRDLRLQRDSPGVDSARAEYAPRVDILGRKRPSGAGYDMGAFERR